MVLVMKDGGLKQYRDDSTGLPMSHPFDPQEAQRLWTQPHGHDGTSFCATASDPSSPSYLDQFYWEADSGDLTRRKAREESGRHETNLTRSLFDKQHSSRLVAPKGKPLRLTKRIIGFSAEDADGIAELHSVIRGDIDSVDARVDEDGNPRHNQYLPIGNLEHGNESTELALHDEVRNSTQHSLETNPDGKGAPHISRPDPGHRAYEGSEIQRLQDLDRKHKRECDEQSIDPAQSLRRSRAKLLVVEDAHSRTSGQPGKRFGSILARPRVPLEYEPAVTRFEQEHLMYEEQFRLQLHRDMLARIEAETRLDYAETHLDVAIVQLSMTRAELREAEQDRDGSWIELKETRRELGEMQRQCFALQACLEKEREWPDSCSMPASCIRTGQIIDPSRSTVYLDTETQTDFEDAIEPCR